MLPITPEFLSGDDAPRSCDALLSEIPRDGLFVIRRKVEQAATRPAASAAAATAEHTTQAEGQNVPSRAGAEGPVVGVVSLRSNADADGSDSADTAANSSELTVHTMDCLVYSAALTTL